MRKKHNTCAGPKNNFCGIDEDVHPFAYGVSLRHSLEMRQACDNFFKDRGMPYGNQYLSYGSKATDKRHDEEKEMEVEHV